VFNPTHSIIGFHRYVSTAQQVSHKWGGIFLCGKMGRKSLDLGVLELKNVVNYQEFWLFPRKFAISHWW